MSHHFEISTEKAKKKKETARQNKKKETNRNLRRNTEIVYLIAMSFRFVCFKLLFSRSFEIIICNDFDSSQHNLTAAADTFMVKCISSFEFMCLSV